MAVSRVSPTFLALLVNANHIRCAECHTASREWKIQEWSLFRSKWSKGMKTRPANELTVILKWLERLWRDLSLD